MPYSLAAPQNYTSASSTAKAEVIVEQMRKINPAAKFGTFQADV